MSNLSNILNLIDLNKLESFYRKNYTEIEVYHPHSSTFKQLITYGLEWAQQTGLHLTSNLNVLDLGTCGGHIPFIYNFFGHNAIGIEMMDKLWMEEMANLLKVRRFVYTINVQTSLPKQFQNLDYITGHNLTFDFNWKPKDWEYFIESLSSNNLKKGGKIYFSLNYHFKKKEYQKVWEKIGLFVNGNKMRYLKV